MLRENYLEILKDAKKKKRWTNKQLAARIGTGKGYHPVYVGSIMSGKRKPLGTIYEIAYELGCLKQITLLED